MPVGQSVNIMKTKGEVSIGGFIPHHTALIEYPFPLRPGVRAVLTLPEDLTETEAKRLVRFVESLAVPDQLSIITGEATAE